MNKILAILLLIPMLVLAQTTNTNSNIISIPTNVVTQQNNDIQYDVYGYLSGGGNKPTKDISYYTNMIHHKENAFTKIIGFFSMIFMFVFVALVVTFGLICFCALVVLIIQFSPALYFAILDYIKKQPKKRKNAKKK